MEPHVSGVTPPSKKSKPNPEPLRIGDSLFVVRVDNHFTEFVQILESTLKQCTLQICSNHNGFTGIMVRMFNETNTVYVDARLKCKEDDVVIKDGAVYKVTVTLETLLTVVGSCTGDDMCNIRGDTNGDTITIDVSNGVQASSLKKWVLNRIEEVDNEIGELDVFENVQTYIIPRHVMTFATGSATKIKAPRIEVAAHATSSHGRHCLTFGATSTLSRFKFRHPCIADQETSEWHVTEAQSDDTTEGDRVHGALYDLPSMVALVKPIKDKNITIKIGPNVPLTLTCTIGSFGSTVTFVVGAYIENIENV